MDSPDGWPFSQKKQGEVGPDFLPNCRGVLFLSGGVSVSEDPSSSPLTPVKQQQQQMLFLLGYFAEGGIGLVVQASCSLEFPSGNSNTREENALDEICKIKLSKPKTVVLANIG